MRERESERERERERVSERERERESERMGERDITAPERIRRRMLVGTKEYRLEPYYKPILSTVL